MRTRIKEFRARHNLTQQELAEAIGVTRQTINAIEQGKYSPSLELAHRIAMHLESKIDELFLFDGHEHHIGHSAAQLSEMPAYFKKKKDYVL